MEENIFKALETDISIPEETKGELIGDIERAKVLKELTDLFSIGFYEVFTNFFSSGEN